MLGHGGNVVATSRQINGFDGSNDGAVRYQRRRDTIASTADMSNRMNVNKLVAVVVVAAACGHKADAPVPAPSPTPSQVDSGPPYDGNHLPYGLDVKLSDGTQGPPAANHDKPTEARWLVDTTPLFAGMKPPAADPTSAFVLRPGSQPPPKPGSTIATSFPAPPSDSAPPAGSDSGELRVLRYAPQGVVPIAPSLSITFSEPMIALGSQDDAARVQPVKLTPQPKGAWRWIGTRTIVFDPDPRFPQATTYRVEVPAGTKSATGGVLDRAVAFSFETPAAVLVAHSPDDDEPQRLDVPMFARFDQRIDPAAALAQVKLKANGRSIEVRQLTAAELAASEPLRELTKTNDGRWLAFRATETLPLGAHVAVTFGSGLPSLEGPNKTKAPQTFAFRTYAAFKLDSQPCITGCLPGAALFLVMDNSIDAKTFDANLVTVTPAIANLHVTANGRVLQLAGDTQPRTHYRVNVGRALGDEFGQTLAKDLDVGFDVGDAQPAFYGPSGMVVLDPKQPPALHVFTTNYEQLAVKLYAVTPADYAAYQTFVNGRWNHDHPPRAPGRLAFDGLVRVTPGTNRVVDTAIDLSPALHDKHGDVVAVVEPSPWAGPEFAPQLISWVQATPIGLDTHVDADKLVAYASDLATGKPLANAQLVLEPGHATAETDASGVATIELPSSPPSGTASVVASAGDAHAFVVSWRGSWSVGQPTRIAWYVADDRNMYRPGEKVALKGWLRELGRGDVEPLDSNVTEVAYRLIDGRGDELAKGTTKVGRLGGFSVELALPATPNLGYTRVDMTANGETFSHQIRIEEFRRPEFEVSAHAGAGPYVVAGTGADATVAATYYSGGPLAGADVHWAVSASATSFTPPNRDDYTFGGFYGDDEPDPKTPVLPASWTHDGKTDATGDNVLHLDFASVNPAMPMSVVAQARVMDVNHQAWPATTTLLVHPSAAYVGVKPHKAFVAQGTPFDVDVIGVGIDGKPLAGTKISLRAVRLDWEQKAGRYRTKELDPQTCDVIAAQAAQPCHFATPAPGTYRLVATIADSRGRPNRTQLTYWVAGGATGTPRTDVAMIADNQEYKIGDVAHVLVAPPFYPAEGLVTWRRNGIVKVQRMTFDKPSTILDLPITEDLVPNIYLHVDVVGETGDDKHAAYAAGEVSLAIPAKTRTLGVTIASAAPVVAPGATTRFDVKVVDAAGKPVANADVAVMAVDESVLAIAGYTHPNPIDTFYASRASGVEDLYSRSWLGSKQAVLTRSRFVVDGLEGNGAFVSDRRLSFAGDASEVDMPAASPAPTTVAQDETAVMKMPMGGKVAEREPDETGKDESGGKASPSITAIRSNFDPLATFAPAVETGADGTAHVSVKLPDNLTRYRLVAIAAAGAKQFGKGEGSLTARLPLMVRPSAPRFLDYGDTFRLPIAVQNQTDRAMTVKLGVRATNAAITAGAGREVTVPPNDRVLVELPMAAERAGTARIQVVGVSGDYHDAAELVIPVHTPATTEAFATYGVIDAGAVAQPVALPSHVVPDFGGLEVSTSSTNLASLTDALLYLVHYPFDCAEQRASRIVGIASLIDEIAAFHAEDLPASATLSASMSDDLDHLANMQNGDGGFAYWDRGEPSDPYLTIFVVDSLQRAGAKGLAMSPELIANARVYLDRIETHIPSSYGKDATLALEAYALATRRRIGDPDLAKAQRLVRETGADKLPIEAAGWLLEALAGDPKAAVERAALVRFAQNRVTETASAANFTTSYGDGAHLLLASDRRADAVMLEAFIDDQPKSELIPKLVQGLLAHRAAGRWDTTQENAFVLVALDRYFRTYEKITPDFVARVWLGDDYAGDHKFAGRTTETHEVDIAMADVAPHDGNALTIAKDGAGRLYYRAAMTYAPASLKLAPADRGFAVARRYESIDDPHDVTRAADGTWHIKAGARVRVRVSMVNDARRYQVALVDPLPAGLEPLNPDTALAETVPADANAQSSWWGRWYEHQNMRDDRVEAFATLLWEGEHDYDYVARATTPGDFVVAPPKAEEMYAPETFGRGASDRVIVE
jgi:hypothetical protein